MKDRVSDKIVERRPVVIKGTVLSCWQEAFSLDGYCYNSAVFQKKNIEKEKDVTQLSSSRFCVLLQVGSQNLLIHFDGRRALAGMRVGSRITIEGVAYKYKDYFVMKNPVIKEIFLNEQE